MPTYAFMCERCKKSFEVVLTVAARAAANAACPGAWPSRISLTGPAVYAGLSRSRH
jgi:putative FmdB family regulatory protein